MANWFKRLVGRQESQPEQAAEPAIAKNVAIFEAAPEFSTRLAIDSGGGPGKEKAEALYRKWAAKWQEF